MARQSGGSRGRVMGLIGLLGLLVLGFFVWWLVFRDNSAASVDSVEAAEARQAAIDNASAQTAEGSEATETETTATDDTTQPETATAADGGDGGVDTTVDTTVDSGQPDSAASVGSPIEGLWNVDTSIGTFGPECLDIVCSAGFVGFRINEELAGVGAKTVVGRTPVVTGSLEVAGTQITSVSIVADMTELITDDPGRTAAIRGVTGGLETEKFPEARFELTEPIELGEIPVEGASVDVQAVGDLTVHGVTKQVSIPLVAEQQAGLVVVFGSLVDIPLSDFDIPKPTSIVVLSVEEIATMELQLFFSR